MKTLTTMFAVIASATLRAAVLDVPVASGTQNGYTGEQLAAIAGGEVTEIRKTGAGTLVSSGIKTFTGTIRVAAGVMKVSDATGLGTSAGPTVVEAGATLHFDSLSSGYTTYKSERYELAGDGCNASPAETNGAIRITGTTCQLSHLTLTADASIRSEKGFHFYDDGDSTIDMGGKVLRLYSADTGNLDVEWKLDGIVNPGHLEVHNARYFRPVGSPLAGGGDHEVRLYGRAGLLLESIKENKTWSIVRCGGGGFYQIGNSATWNGPLENRNVSSAFAMSVGAGKTLTFNGPLRGMGGFLKDAHLGTVVLNGTNTFTGVFEVKGGGLVLGCEAAASDSILDRFSFTVLTVGLGLTAKTDVWPQGWSATAFSGVLESFRTAAKKNVSVSLHARTGDSAVVPVTFTGDYSSTPVGAVEGGATACAATFADSPNLHVIARDTLTITRPEGSDGCGALGGFTVSDGTLAFDEAGFVDFGTGTFTLGANNSSRYTSLNVGAGTVLGRSDTGGGYIALPYSADTAGAMMEVAAGAIVTNLIHFSMGSTRSAGSLYVRGGEVYAPYTGSHIGHIGSRGQGCIAVTDGRFTATGFVYLGMNGSGVGQIEVSGGTFSVLNESYALYVGVAGTGVVYQTGGTVSSPLMNVASSAFNNDVLSGYGAYTIAGESAVTEISGRVSLGSRKAGTALLNLNGGVFEAGSIAKSASAGPDARAYVNIDGGTVRMTDDTTNLFGRVDAVTVCAGGATIDTDGHDVAVDVPFTAPGTGAFASITVDAAAFAGTVCAPYIVIEGDGEGASAVAQFDPDTRTVTGVTVTSPGRGYTAENTTVKAVYRGRVKTEAPFDITSACSFTLTDAYADIPVKLTKRGAGTLTLAPGVLPANAELRVEGGDVGGDGLVFSDLTVDLSSPSCGGISAWPDGATLTLEGLDGVDEDVARYDLLTFASSATAVVPPLASGCTLPRGWRLVVRGRTLRLEYPRVMILTIR